MPVPLRPSVVTATTHRKAATDSPSGAGNRNLAHSRAPSGRSGPSTWYGSPAHTGSVGPSRHASQAPAHALLALLTRPRPGIRDTRTAQYGCGAGSRGHRKARRRQHHDSPRRGLCPQYLGTLARQMDGDGAQAHRLEGCRSRTQYLYGEDIYAIHMLAKPLAPDRDAAAIGEQAPATGICPPLRHGARALLHRFDIANFKELPPSHTGAWRRRAIHGIAPDRAHRRKCIRQDEPHRRIAAALHHRQRNPPRRDPPRIHRRRSARQPAQPRLPWLSMVLLRLRSPHSGIRFLQT